MCATGSEITASLTKPLKSRGFGERERDYPADGRPLWPWGSCLQTRASEEQGSTWSARSRSEDERR